MHPHSWLVVVVRSREGAIVALNQLNPGLFEEAMQRLELCVIQSQLRDRDGNLNVGQNAKSLTSTEQAP